MKRIISAALSLALVLALAACSGPEKPVDTPTEQPEEVPTEPELVLLGVLQGEDSQGEWHENTPLCSATWQSFSLCEESAAAYPALAERLRELNEENRQYAQGFVQDNREYALEMMGERDGYFYGLTSDEQASVRRADEHILSIRCDCDEYTGGVHPNYLTYGINLDPGTGEGLELTDILVRTDTLSGILEQKILEKYPYEMFSSLGEMLAEYEPHEFSWTLDYQGLTVYFSPYEIASYAAGLLTATIWFDEYPELFREEYLRQPTHGYMTAVPVNLPLDIDLEPGDDLRDSFVLERVPAEYDYVYPGVNVNGEALSDEEAYGYWLRPYLVWADAKAYAYVEGRAENDYTTLSVYDLNGETPTLVGRIYGTGFHGEYFEDEGEYGTIRAVVFDDAQAFTLDTRIDLLGTMTGTGVYAVDPATGMPRALEDWYVLDEERPPLTSLVPLTLPILPGGQAEEIPAGTRFYFLRTDGCSYVDMKLSDGRECRVGVEIGPEGWGSYINGMDEWDCFEGLLYAG